MIIGTALNQDGHTNGISLPSPEAQARLVRDACADAGVDPVADRFCRSARHRHRGRRSDRSARARGGALRRPARGCAAAHRLGEDEPRPLETAAGVAGPGQSAARAQAPADSGQPPFRDAESEHRLRGTEAARAHRARAVPGDGRPAHGGREFVRLRRRQRARHSRGTAGAPAARSMRSRHEQRAWPIVLSARSEEALRGIALHLAAWLAGACERQRRVRRCCPISFTRSARGAITTRTASPSSHSSMQELVQELDGFARQARRARGRAPPSRRAASSRRASPS